MKILLNFLIEQGANIKKEIKNDEIPLFWIFEKEFDYKNQLNF